VSNFIDKASWKYIDRGFEFEAAMVYPSDTKRPLSFFVPDPTNPNKGVIHENIGNFAPVNNQAIEQKIVMTIKPRRVVILSDDEINHMEDYEYILVAPINTIKRYEKQKEWYKKVIQDNHPIFAYLPNGNLERYVDLSQTTTIHKSLLLRKLSQVPPDRMDVLEQTLLECLSLGIVEENFEEGFEQVIEEISEEAKK
jgi:mRNA-degrading endonuclease toxin of MazEF toxin-antitoxin module